MREICEVIWLGLAPYKETWVLQERMALDIAAGKRPPTLLLLEHPHTYTFGRRGNAGNLLWDSSELERRGISVHWVDRGGDITYHGPGQLVGYPLLPLTPIRQIPDGSADSSRIPQADYMGYLRKLEELLIETLADFGVVSGQMEGLTGVWMSPDVHSRCLRCPPEEKLPPAKIAAIGVKVDARGISRHGFALNIDPDMTYFDGMIGCGLKGYPVTSLAERMVSPPSVEEVRDVVIEKFSRKFNYEMKIRNARTFPTQNSVDV